MTSRYTDIPVFPPKKGLKSTTNTLLLTLDDLTKGSDIIFTSSYERAQRPGLSRYDTRTGNVDLTNPYTNYVYDFHYRDGANVMQHSTIKINGAYINADNDDGQFNEITGVTRPGPDSYVSMETFTNRCIIGFSDITLQYWTGAGVCADLSVDAPDGWIIRKHKGRLFVAGDPAHRHRLYYCDFEDTAVWVGVGAGYLDIDTDDDDPEGITALFPSFFGELYVAKSNSIYVIKGSTPSTFTSHKIIEGIGCIGHNTVTHTQNDILFVSRHGVCSLVQAMQSAGIAFDTLSFDVHDFWLNNVDVTKGQRFFAKWIPEYNSYILLYCTADSDRPDAALVYNVVMKAWCEWPIFEASSLTKTVRSTTSHILVGLNDGSVAVLSADNLTDRGVLINPVIKIGPNFLSPDLSFDLAFKGLTTAYSAMNLGYVKATYIVDDLGANTLYLTPHVPVDDVTGSFVEKKGIKGHGKTLSIQYEKAVEGDLLDDSFTLDESVLGDDNTYVAYAGFAVQVDKITNSEKKQKVR